LGVNLFRRFVICFVVFVVQVVADQATKQWAVAELKGTPARIYLNDIFRFQYATNDGAFLSLGTNLPPTIRFLLLNVGVGILLLGLTIYAFTNKKLDTIQAASYALIASGGFSNWVDRARFEGSVVDFMNMGISSLRTGIFNVADLAILVGIGVLFIQSSKLEKKAKLALAQAQAAEPKDIAETPSKP
jgi:signal peptidase II